MLYVESGTCVAGLCWSIIVGKYVEKRAPSANRNGPTPAPPSFVRNGCPFTHPERAIASAGHANCLLRVSMVIPAKSMLNGEIKSVVSVQV